MKYLNKKTNMICFDGTELKQIFEEPSRRRLAEEISKSGYSSIDLLKDKTKMQKIVDKFKLVKDKEEKEIFSALYLFPKFYPKESKICFLLKYGVDPRKESIDTLQKLKSSLKEKDLTDFLFWHDDGVRAYQLKAYLGKTEINDFFEYLKKVLLHYANDLGETNLLITIESGGNFTGSFFKDIHERLKKFKLKGTGHILVTYNEENKYDVMNTVYPTLGTKRIKHENFSGT